MASSYVNDLRLNEMATGDASGTWGTNTNVNLELIGEGLGYGTEAITTNADTHASVVADGATDPVRAMYVEYTGTLDSACTITISPNTINRMHFIENGTSGSQNIIISQGSGANITIPPGDTKAVYLDGAGSGAAVVDAFASLNVVDLKVQDDLTVTDDVTIGGDIDLEGSIDVNGTANLDIVDIDGAVNIAAATTIATNNKIQFRDAAIHISSTADGDLAIAADDEIDLTSTLIDINGNVTISGTLAQTGILTCTDDIIIGDGKTIGSASDVDAMTIASNGQITLTQTLIGTALDISGAIDVDGVTNLDVTDIDGTLNVAGVATAQVSANINQVALTSSSAAVAWDAAAAANAFHVTTENTTLSAPSNPVEGAIISIEIAQGGTPRTFAFNTVFEFAASTAPTITATASKTDILAFRYNGSVWQEIGRSQNMAQT